MSKPRGTLFKSFTSKSKTHTINFVGLLPLKMIIGQNNDATFKDQQQVYLQCWNLPFAFMLYKIMEAFIRHLIS